MSRCYSIVVVPVDFSERSPVALAAAKELVEEGGKIHVMHALLPLSAMEPGVLWGEVDNDSRRAQVTEALQALVDGAGVADAEIAVRLGNIGSPATAVLAYAEDVSADVVVLNSHGRTGLARFALGSVAERVVRYATCDVLVVRARPEGK